MPGVSISIIISNHTTSASRIAVQEVGARDIVPTLMVQSPIECYPFRDGAKLAQLGDVERSDFRTNFS